MHAERNKEAVFSARRETTFDINLPETGLKTFFLVIADPFDDDEGAFV